MMAVFVRFDRSRVASGLFTVHLLILPMSNGHDSGAHVMILSTRGSDPSCEYASDSEDLFVISNAPQNC